MAQGTTEHVALVQCVGRHCIMALGAWYSSLTKWTNSPPALSGYEISTEKSKVMVHTISSSMAEIQMIREQLKEV